MSFVPYNESDQIIYHAAFTEAKRCTDLSLVKRELLISALEAGAAEVRFINDPAHSGKLTCQDNGAGFDDPEVLDARVSRAMSLPKSASNYGRGSRLMSLAVSQASDIPDDPFYPYFIFETQGKKNAFSLKLFNTGKDLEPIPYDRKRGRGTKVVVNGNSPAHKTRITVDKDRDATPLRDLNGRFWEVPKTVEGRSADVFGEAWGTDDAIKMKGLRHYLDRDKQEFMKTVKIGDFKVTAMRMVEKAYPSLNRYTNLTQKGLRGKVLVVHQNEVYLWGRESAWPAGVFGVNTGTGVTIIVELADSDRFSPDPTRHHVEEEILGRKTRLNLTDVGAQYEKQMPARLQEILQKKMTKKAQKSKENARYFRDNSAVKFFSNIYMAFSKKGNQLKPVVPADTTVGGDKVKGFDGKGGSQGPKHPDPKNPMGFNKTTTTGTGQGLQSTTKQGKGKKKRVREIFDVPTVKVGVDHQEGTPALQWASATEPVYAPSSGNVINLVFNPLSVEAKTLLEAINTANQYEKETKIDMIELTARVVHSLELEAQVLFQFACYKKTKDEEKLTPHTLSALISNPKHFLRTPRSQRDSRSRTGCW